MAKKAGPLKSPATPAKAKKVLDALEKAHPNARIFLNYENPFQLLIATILAAQCTDDRVNQVAPRLFERYPAAADIANAKPADIEEIIRSTGTFRQKTQSILACCQALVRDHGGEVPADVDELTKIRGVGRKTANIVLGAAFGQQAIAVDTHVFRVAHRIGLADSRYPDKVEQQLCSVIPRERWTATTLVLGTHGRRICAARKPDCANCPVSRMCDFSKAASA